MSNNTHTHSERHDTTMPPASIDDLAADIRAAGLRTIERYARWDQTVGGLTDACATVQPATPHPTRVQPPNMTAETLLSANAPTGSSPDDDNAAPTDHADTDAWDLTGGDSRTDSTQPRDSDAAPAPSEGMPHDPVVSTPIEGFAEQPTAEHARQPQPLSPDPAATNATAPAPSEPDRTAIWAKRLAWLIGCLVLTPLLAVVPLTLRATKNMSRTRRIWIVGTVTALTLVMAALLTSYANTLD